MSSNSLDETLKDDDDNEVDDLKDLNKNEIFYTDDPNQLVLNQEKKDKFLKLVNAVTNQTSRDELVKRMR